MGLRRIQYLIVLVGGACLLPNGSAFATDTGAPNQQTLPSIFISVDMEGVAGAVTDEQLRIGGFEFEKFREILTNEVLAAIQGARAAGAGEIVVADSHGNGQNILVDRLPTDIRLIRGEPRPLSMVEGIQSREFSGAIFIGYHASASNPGGVRAHTKSSARISEIRVNGSAASEGLLYAAVAGEYGVPVIMVSGGDRAIEEIVDVIGPIEQAVVKQAIGFHSAETLTPMAAQDLIREKAQIAVQRIEEFDCASY